VQPKTSPQQVSERLLWLTSDQYLASKSALLPLDTAADQLTADLLLIS
jgi:hypothetical protein